MVATHEGTPPACTDKERAAANVADEFTSPIPCPHVRRQGVAWRARRQSCVPPCPAAVTAVCNSMLALGPFPPQNRSTCLFSRGCKSRHGEAQVQRHQRALRAVSRARGATISYTHLHVRKKKGALPFIFGQSGKLPPGSPGGAQFCLVIASRSLTMYPIETTQAFGWLTCACFEPFGGPSIN